MTLLQQAPIKAPNITIKQSLLTRSFLKFYVVGTFAYLLLCSYISAEGLLNHLELSVLLLLTGIVSVVGQHISIKKNAVIHFLSYFFLYSFMSIAPIIQIGVNSDPVFSLEQDAEFAAASGLLFALAGLIFLLKKTPKAQNEITAYLPKRHLVLFCITFVICIAALLLFHEGLFTTRTKMARVVGSYVPDVQTGLILSTILFSAPVYGAVLGLRAALEQKKRGWVLAHGVMLILAFALNSPMTAARFQLAGFAIFFIDYFFKGKRMALIVLFILLGTICAPILNGYRNSITKAEAQGLSAGLSLKGTYLSYDYDSFVVASYMVQSTKQGGFSWGENLAGALLFFIPRSIWSDKPQPTAFIAYDTMIKHRSVGTKNLSTPLMAEGYYAFGFFGVIGIALIYWAAISRLHRLSNTDKNSLAFISRSICAGLVLIFLRGTLTVSVSALVGALVVSYSIWKIMYKKTTVGSMLPASNGANFVRMPSPPVNRNKR